MQRVVNTKKTELLFLAAIIRLLKVGGRAAVIVPDGVLFGASNAHKELRRILVVDQKLDGIVKLPAGVFKPYAGVSTAILLFTKTNSGGTNSVWFFDVESDGFSLDDKRLPLDESDLAQVLSDWNSGQPSENSSEANPKSFTVSRTEIEQAGFDLSINRYRTAVGDSRDHRSPTVILSEMHADHDRASLILSTLKDLLA